LWGVKHRFKQALRIEQPVQKFSAQGNEQISDVPWKYRKSYPCGAEGEHAQGHKAMNRF
jgi:hypothetical protein